MPSERAALLVGVLFPLALFAAVAAAVSGGDGIPWDAELLRFAEGHYQVTAVDSLDIILRAIVGASAVLSAAMVIVFLIAHRRRHALVWVLGVGGAFALDSLLKNIFRRPELGGSGGVYSFPSGGAMASVAVLLALVLTAPSVWRRSLLLVGVPLLLIEGGALVYAWWHYPSDVVGGWCFGSFWLTGCWLLLFRPRRRAVDAPDRTATADG